ncbi:aminotransferase class IV [Catellatospora sp. TT07R-123]|uniref:aminotransferase class IV n=1 Tax=Catellatospora sp. TT07R-123 TaxID=2733863 RepID=UPI001BB3A87E|nr:aminotransferase class IV [Catellatospora sp. TT07R-123]
MDEQQEYRVEIDGRPADAEARAMLEHAAWGHFTAMQVRGGRTRGFDLHLARLTAAHRDVYASDLDPDLVHARVRHALAGIADASVRVYGYWDGVIVAVRSPAGMPARPHSMQPRRFQRPHARFKHSNGTAPAYHRQQALAAGFDEGLFTTADGTIAEGTITNVGFWRDGTVTWPDAPALPGITMLVLRRQLEAAAVPQRRAPVKLPELDSYQGMFLCNSRGWAPVHRVGQTSLPVPPAMLDTITTAYDTAPLDLI